MSMITKIPSFLFLWLSILLNTNPDPTRMNSSALGLKGPVRTWSFQPGSFFNQDCGLSPYSLLMMKFDSQGTITSQAVFGDPVEFRTTTWPSGKVAEQLFFAGGTTNLEGKLSYYYNREGQISRKIFSFMGKDALFEYHYDDLNQLDFIALYNYPRTLTDPLMPTDENMLFTIFYYGTDQRLYKVESFRGGKKQYEDQLFYDSQGRLVSMKGRTDMILEYQDDGLPVKMHFGEGNDYSMSYTYDQQGNVTEINETDLNSGTNFKSVIHIRYWK